MASTPAIVVVLTAPKPTSSTPNLPRAGAISTGEGTGRNYISFSAFTSQLQRTAPHMLQLTAVDRQR
jgi:hypothetical protein